MSWTQIFSAIHEQRAGGLAWLRYRLDMAGFEGSNPFRPIQSSVQIPKKIRKQNAKIAHANLICKNQHRIYNNILDKDEVGVTMRDLYNRKARLEYWIQRVNTDLKGKDRVDLLRLIEYMQDKERANLWIIRCITALISLRKQLKKPFQHATKEDMRALLIWMDQVKHYRASTNEKFRQILKLFYKVVYGNGESYPEQVKFFSSRVGKEKHTQPTYLNTAEFLEEDEVIRLIQSAPTIQKKAFIACMYESGARPEEFLRITNSDFIIDSKGIVLILRGKTGERRVRIITYAKVFQQWLDVHPLKSQSNYSIWISESTNYKNKALGLRGAEKIIEDLMPKVLANKHARLYILRHSRATHLANHFTQAQMCVFFGWVQNSHVVQRYIHLSGKDLDGVLVSLNNSGNVSQSVQDYKIKPIKCTRCKEDIPPGNTFCGKCSLPVSLSEQYMNETLLEEKNRLLELKIDEIENNMNEKLTKLMLLIQQNPKLALVKPNVLLENI